MFGHKFNKSKFIRGILNRDITDLRKVYDKPEDESPQAQAYRSMYTESKPTKYEYKKPAEETTLGYDNFVANRPPKMTVICSGVSMRMSGSIGGYSTPTMYQPRQSYTPTRRRNNYQSDDYFTSYAFYDACGVF